MIDKAAIFSDVTHRNNLRRTNGLPPLDVRARYDAQVALAKDRDFRDRLPVLMTQYANDHAAIRQQVIIDLWGDRADAYRDTKAGQYAIRVATHKRFLAFLRDQGVDVPDAAPVTNAVVYGGG